MEQIFFHYPPSFYALISGALIGIATNLLTSLLFAAKDITINPTLIKVAIFYIFLSSACFGYLSIILEQLRGSIISSDKATINKRLEQNISNRQEFLWFLIIMALESIGIGIFFIYGATIS